MCAKHCIVNVCTVIASTALTGKPIKRLQSYVADKNQNAARFVIGTRWVIREGYPSSSETHVSNTRLATNDPALCSAGPVCLRDPTKLLRVKRLKLFDRCIFSCSLTRFPPLPLSPPPPTLPSFLPSVRVTLLMFSLFSSSGGHRKRKYIFHAGC